MLLLIQTSPVSSRLCLIVSFSNLYFLEIYAVRSEIENNGVDLLDAEGKKFKRLTEFTTPPEEPKGCGC